MRTWGGLRSPPGFSFWGGKGSLCCFRGSFPFCPARDDGDGDRDDVRWEGEACRVVLHSVGVDGGVLLVGFFGGGGTGARGVMGYA